LAAGRGLGVGTAAGADLAPAVGEEAGVADDMEARAVAGSADGAAAEHPAMARPRAAATTLSAGSLDIRLRKPEKHRLIN